MQRAWKRVKSNAGAAGIDGRNIEETEELLKKSWPAIKEQLLKGTYRPKPVRRVEIPKDDGGVRKLGIPTVVDRLIQQALTGVLQEEWDKTFHPASYGFRPGRSAHQAIDRVKEIINTEARNWCVDIDLEKFFDSVNHDILMDRVRKRLSDERVIRLIRLYLKSGIMEHGLLTATEEGTPQGGPLSPLLSNLLLNDLDWELEKRGLRFVRYADDCNLYARSEIAAKRAMQTMRKLTDRLGLRINESKSDIGKASAGNRKFLGYGLFRRKGRAQHRIATKSLRKFKRRVRQLTRRVEGKRLEDIVSRLNAYTGGWRAYFGKDETLRRFDSLDSWIRRRLRAIQLRQWKRGNTCYEKLTARGVSHSLAASTAKYRRSWWRMAKYEGLHAAFPNSYFREIGYVGLAK